jgi:hypothetical protein
MYNNHVRPKEVSTFTLPQGIIVLVKYTTRYEVCSSFLRMQEFYETSLTGMQGRYFSWEEYMDEYARARGNFSYTMDWSGFNIPGGVFREWGERFPTYDRMVKEKNLYLDVMNAYGSALTMSGESDLPFYVIGTYMESPRFERVVMHEMAHAMWTLDPEYKSKALSLLTDTEKNDTVWEVLKKWGYDEKVKEDELNAYLATSSEWEMGDKFLVTGVSPSHYELFIEQCQKNGIPVYNTPSETEEAERETKYRDRYLYNAGEIV